MAVAANDIYQRLLKSIQEGADVRPRMMNVGTVISVGDGVARISAGCAMASFAAIRASRTQRSCVWYRVESRERHGQRHRVG